METFASLLAGAKSPLLMLGGPGWNAQAIDDARSFAQNFELPVCTSFRAKDRFDNTHKNYCGDVGIGADPKLVKRLKESDLLIVVGARLGEMTTDGYKRIPTNQTLIHVHPGADELNRVYQADLAILSGVAPFLREAASLNTPRGIAWRDTTQP